MAEDYKKLYEKEKEKVGKILREVKDVLDMNERQKVSIRNILNSYSASYIMSSDYTQSDLSANSFTKDKK